jgi:hypothetical protein
MPVDKACGVASQASRHVGGAREAGEAVLTAVAQGWQPWQLAEKLRIPREAARSLLAACLLAMPGLAAFVEAQWTSLRDRGSVTSLAGRLCAVECSFSSDPKVAFFPCVLFAPTRRTLCGHVAKSGFCAKGGRME